MASINELLFRRKKSLKTITAIKDPNIKNKLVKHPSHIPNIVNEHEHQKKPQSALEFLKVPF